jgi:hypothetical protein
MRRDNLFWGGMLILFGGLFFLQALGYIKDVMGWFWPLVLMSIGAWIILGRFWPSNSQDAFISGQSEPFSIQLQGAQKLHIDLDHGMGQVDMSGGAAPGMALEGLKGMTMDVDSELSGDTLEVDIDAGPSSLPFIGPESGAWQFRLTNEVPVSMDVDAGATSLNFDLREVRLSRLDLDTGASSIRLVLPERAENSFVEIDFGAASLDVTVPEGVALRLEMHGGASSLSIDETRFPRRSAGFYESADYPTATHRVEMRLEGGANSVTIH